MWNYVDYINYTTAGAVGFAGCFAFVNKHKICGYITKKVKAIVDIAETTKCVLVSLPLLNQRIQTLEKADAHTLQWEVFPM